MSITLEVLHVVDCPNLQPMLERLRQVTDRPSITREIDSNAAAAAFGMAGSPTLLINGRDPFPHPNLQGCRGRSCRSIATSTVGRCRRLRWPSYAPLSPPRRLRRHRRY